MSTASLQPTGLAPSAVLFIRRWDDPLPGVVSLHEATACLPRAWEQAAHASLEQLLKRASHPGHGSVPANAEAVVFADEAEMLVCLALDMSLGQALGRWWWQAILWKMPSASSDGLPDLLRARARLLPAVFHHLAERGRATEILEALAPEQARVVLSAMCRAFDMPDFSLGSTDSPDRADGRTHPEHESDEPNFESEEADVHGAPEKADLQPDQGGNHRPAAKPRRLQQTRSKARLNEMPSTMQAPWEELLPGQIPAAMIPQRACLLGVALSLYSAPAAARSSWFRDALHGWLKTPVISRKTSAPAQAVPGSCEGIPALPIPGKPADIAAPRDDRGSGHEPSSSGFSGPQTAHDYGIESASFDSSPPADVVSWPTPLHQIAPSQSLTPAPKFRRSAPDPEVPAALPHAITSPHFQQSTELQLREISDEAGQTASQEAVLFSGEGFDTRLGGIFYLINLMRCLGLPACFEEDWHLATQVGAWGVLETLARALLDDDSHALTRDPIWPALAHLDGRRPGELPGKDFAGAGCCCMPAHWLAQLTGERIDFYDPLLRASVAGSLAGGLNPHLARWLEFVLPYINIRLRQSLGLKGNKSRDLHSALLLRPGRLYVTSTHVDVVMNLIDVSVPVRIAGLDCSPGWLPDFCRVVLFHFE